MRAAVLLAAFAVLAGCGAERAPEPFAVGQTWTYQTRAKEPGATVSLVAVEKSARYGEVFFVTLNNIQLKTAQGTLRKIGGVAFTRAALERSLAKFEVNVSRPQGIDSIVASWREEEAAGKSPHAYDTTIAQALDDLERTDLRAVGRDP